MLFSYFGLVKQLEFEKYSNEKQPMQSIIVDLIGMSRQVRKQKLI